MFVFCYVLMITYDIVVAYTFYEIGKGQVTSSSSSQVLQKYSYRYRQNYHTYEITALSYIVQRNVYIVSLFYY